MRNPAQGSACLARPFARTVVDRTKCDWKQAAPGSSPASPSRLERKAVMREVRVSTKQVGQVHVSEGSAKLANVQNRSIARNAFSAGSGWSIAIFDCVLRCTFAGPDRQLHPHKVLGNLLKKTCLAQKNLHGERSCAPRQYETCMGRQRGPRALLAPHRNGSWPPDARAEHQKDGKGSSCNAGYSGQAASLRSRVGSNLLMPVCACHCLSSRRPERAARMPPASHARVAFFQRLENEASWACQVPISLTGFHV